MRKTIQQYKQMRANGARLRPLWQIAIMVPIAIVAQSSEALRVWLENKFDPVDPDFWKD